MITLYQFPPAFGLPVSASQFCTKIELYLRLTGRDYEVATADLCKSPERQAPWVTWPDGHSLADSGQIIDVLEREDVALDRELSTVARTASEVLRSLSEGPVYFACQYARFVEQHGWQYQKEVVRRRVPHMLAPMLLRWVRRSQAKRCAVHGFRQRKDFAKGVVAVNQLSDALGSNPYMLGEEIQSVDCAVWANLVHAAYTPSDNPLRHAVRSDPMLLAYIERVALLADWELPVINPLRRPQASAHLQAMRA